MQRQPNSAMCFVCGRDNAIGLHVHFFADEQNRVFADFTARQEHQSYPGVMHGGLVAALLDETIGRAAIARNIWCMTAQLDVRYKKPVPLGEPLRVMGEFTDIDKRILRGRGELRRVSDNVLLAQAEGTYLRLPADTQAAMADALLDWRVDELDTARE